MEDAKTEYLSTNIKKAVKQAHVMCITTMNIRKNVDN